MARSPIQAAGGIVFRPGAEPLVAVVRLTKGNDWVLPKGKLNDGETARAAAEREVWEETGHAVSVRDFLGKLTYTVGGRKKVVHFWSMEAGKRVRAPMSDVKDVAWLPLDKAAKRLTRSHEREFLTTVGLSAFNATRSPHASVAASVAQLADKAPARVKKRSAGANVGSTSKNGVPEKRIPRKQRRVTGFVNPFQRLRAWLEKVLARRS